jgi:nitroreductase
MDLKSCDHLLTTTRSVRKRLDLERPVEPELIEECLEIALQAPTGSNRQGWHFIIVTDADRKKGLAELYRKAIMIYTQSDARPSFAPEDPRAAQQPRIEASAMYLAEHMEEAPALVVPCVEGRVENEGVLAQASVYGSILPAVWSLMMALRARGLGSAWTTLHLMFEAEAARLLGVPDNLTQCALLPVAYFTGEDFRRAPRLPASEVTHWDYFGGRR